MTENDIPEWLLDAQSARTKQVVVEEQPVLVFGYARFSDDVQHESSITRQEREIRKTVSQFRLPPLAHIYKDEAKTGRDDRREDYRDLLRMLAENPGSILVVENIDRLLRSRSVLADLIKAIEQYDIHVYHNLGPVDRSMFPILGTIAVMNNEEWRHRARFRIDLLKQEGCWMQSPPFGMKRKKKHVVVPDPYLEPYIKEIARRFVAGASYGSLAKYLQKEGVPTPGGAKFWIPSTVKKILLNPIYYGFTPYGEKEQ